MARIKRGVSAHKKHKKIKKLTKGYIHSRRASIKKGREAVLKAGKYSYIHRKKKKSDFRRLWIVKINAALSKHKINYSTFISQLKTKKIDIDRKILAELAEKEPKVFDDIVKEAKK
jgi:large subunit ribosomal protein L20